MHRARHTTLSILIAGDEPPGEFRIFAAGPNETTKGTFLFDEAAAVSVMAEYERHGIDLMLDYDHASLGMAIDPAQAGKAAGWFNLEVRNGELWAVNVRWTPPAAEALKRKEWRFMSPAFQTDDEGRVTSVLNVAITNLPATRRLEPLMAASVTALGDGMDPELVKKAIDALAAGDAEGALGILKDMIASAAGAAVEEPAAEGPAAAELAETPAEDPEEDKPAVAAGMTKLARITDRKTIGAALEVVEVWRESHLKLESELTKLSKEREALEANERDGLVVELVKAGEPPATAWKDPVVATNRAKRKPAEPWASMPIAALRDRVSKLSARKTTAALVPPAGGGGGKPDGSQDFETPDGPVTLSASELSECKRAGAKPEVYAANKAKRLKKPGN